MSRQTVAVIAAVAVVAAAAVVYLLTRGSADPAATDPATAQMPLAPATPTTAAQWLSTSVAAARAEGSVHVDVLTTMRARTLRYSDDDGAGLGIQRITIDPGMHAEVRVLPGMTYFVANRAALVSYFGFPADVADRAAGRWIALRPGQSGFKQVTEGVTFLSMMKEMTLRRPLTLLPARTMRGVKVVGIRGAGAGPELQRVGTVTATLWVQAAGSHLPVLYRASSHRFGSTTAVFSRWGMKVSVETPAAL